MSLRRHLGRAPATFRAVGSLFSLLGQSDDPVAFMDHARHGDIEAAFDTIDRPNEELHREVSALRRVSREAGEGMPEPSPEERERLFQ